MELGVKKMDSRRILPYRTC